MSTMKMVTGSFALLSILVLSGCGGNGSASNATRDAVIGTAAGAALGAVTGDKSNERIVKGAAIGALGGYIYGSEADNRR